MSNLEELAEYQTRLKGKCGLSLQYNTAFEEWEATVQTDKNDFPHWQRGSANTPALAWEKLKSFLDGGPQLHGQRKVKSSDFLAEEGKADG